MSERIVYVTEIDEAVLVNCFTVGGEESPIEIVLKEVVNCIESASLRCTCENETVSICVNTPGVVVVGIANLTVDEDTLRSCFYCAFNDVELCAAGELDILLKLSCSCCHNAACCCV